MQTPTQEQTDVIDCARIAALNILLDRKPGSKAPPFAHQVFFWEPQPAASLGRDGHARTGGLIPDLGLPRRMWAGGRLKFSGDLIAGVAATKATRLVKADRKEGRSGPLALVTLEHTVTQNADVIVTEEQDLVYLPDPDPSAAKPVPPVAPNDAEFRKERKFTTTELFRYSALTFNGHRIHYDRDYCRQIEGYPGLVVHGPLLAQWLMLMAVEHLGTLQAFTFRATSPLFDFEQAAFCAREAGDGLDMWVAGPDGRQCMQAQAT